MHDVGFLIGDLGGLWRFEPINVQVVHAGPYVIVPSAQTNGFRYIRGAHPRVELLLGLGVVTPIFSISLKFLS